jgi:hypothetical protein
VAENIGWACGAFIELNLYKEQQGAFIKQFDLLSANDAGTTPWLECTQFPHYLDGLTTKDIIAFLADDQEIDTEMQLLREAFHVMVTESFKQA